VSFVSFVSNLLIDIEPGSYYITDYTAQEYFEHVRQFRFPCPHVDIAATGITYLSFDIFKRCYPRDYGEEKLFLQSNALLNYAAQFWGGHACHAEDNIQDMILKYLEDPQNILFVGQAMESFASRNY